ncbi:hypothetical protein DL546_003662 [Coniochaeta pulveracea]|uniref:2EXR domain-containing protein n=1 Tax=Coniochaeta pulveracea TaxID=177199 RepID=A0A420Y118_9PEZI|nr:hypothetical protein DL546_003662 [Coniochaeta pulveracea]
MTFNRQHRACHVETVPMSPASDFSYFKRLPAELRTMIWDYALPDSRVYEVLDAPNATQRTEPVAGLIFGDDAQEPPPALAAVCRESRYLVLYHYKPLTLGSTTKYVDLSRDILLLEPYLQIQRLNRALHFMSQIPMIREHINRLALGTSYGIYTGISHPIINWKSVYRAHLLKLLASLAKFPKLHTLIFILHQEFQFELKFPLQPDHIPPPATQSHGFLHPIGPNTVRTTRYPPFHRCSLTAPATTMISSDLPSPPPQLWPPDPFDQPHPPWPPDGQQPLSQHIHQTNSSGEDRVCNTKSIRPHQNELLYYPLDYDEDEDDWKSHAGQEQDDDRWHSTWPTNDDWRRFRRRWIREARMAQHNSRDERKRSSGLEKVGIGDGDVGCKRTATEAFGEDRKERKQVRLAVLAVKGASLLWKYGEGCYV